MISTSITPTGRRNRELGLGLFALVISMAGYGLVALAEQPDLPTDLAPLFFTILLLFCAAHIAVRFLTPNADPTLLPLAVLLNGFGFVMISRINRDQAEAQAGWTTFGIVAFLLTLLLVRDVKLLERYRYTALALGLVAILLPMLPKIGYEENGARLWIRVGPLSGQPAEIAKVLLVIFFAGYLADKRELLASGTKRIGKFRLPDPKHLGPLLLAWGLSILMMVRQKDLGSSLLFFTVFAALVYMATNRARYISGATVMFGSAATIAYQLFDHVQLRVSTWLDPWPTAQSDGFQLTQSLFAFGTGGVSGTGLGLGSPQKIPNPATDFIFSAVGEELGLLGTVAVISALLLLIGSGFRIALRATRPFTKLFAAGLTTVLAVQSFVIIGGVTRVIPLTGVTLPFFSFGGSSLIANWIIIALLMRMSEDAATRPGSVGEVFE